MTDYQSQAFGQVADEYDRRRPGYPPAVISWVAERTDGRRGAEIGAGTGKATIEFLRAGFDIVAVEPDPAMASVGRARVPGARWEVISAEAWDPADRRFDLIYGAQSWHWVPEEADGRLMAAMAPAGTLAWIWNHPDLGPEEGLFGDLYARYLPAGSRRLALHRRDAGYWVERMERVATDVEVLEIEWSRVLAAADYVALTATYSDHITLPPDDRADLQWAVRRRIDAQGGSIELTYTTRAYLGRYSAA